MPTPKQSPPYHPATDNYFEIVWSDPVDRAMKLPHLHLMRVSATGDLCSHGDPQFLIEPQCGRKPTVVASANPNPFDYPVREPTCPSCLLIQRSHVAVLDVLWDALEGFE